MIVETTGGIGRDVYMLGHPAIPLYLVDGRRPVIVDTGFTFMADIYAADIKAVLGNRQPAFCLLTHAHFDHCGATAALKTVFPGMRVAASVHSERILANPRTVDRIRSLNRIAEAMSADLGLATPAAARAFEPFAIDIRIKEGDVLTLSGELTVRVLETPGHTRDSVSYFLPERRVLFPSEAAGIQDPTGYIVIDCLLDYGQYLASLERLIDLDAEIVCVAHRYAYTPPDTGAYLRDALRHCHGFHDTVRRLLAETGGDVRAVMARIRAFEYDPKPSPKQPEAAYLLNLEARVKAVRDHVGTAPSGVEAGPLAEDGPPGAPARTA